MTPVLTAEHRQGAYIIAGETAVRSAMASPVPASTFTALDAKFTTDAVQPLLTGLSSNVWAVYYETAPADWERTLDRDDLARARTDVDVTTDRLSSLLLPSWKTFVAHIGSGRAPDASPETPAARRP